MSYVRISAPKDRVRSNFTRGAVSGMTTITRRPKRIPA